MNRVIDIIGSVWYFVWGKLFSVFIYDKKYLRGKYFENKFFGIGRIGWKWVCADFISRLLYGVNKNIPWPVSPSIRIGDYKNIEFDLDDLRNFQSYGCYFQAVNGKLKIGKGTYVAPNVGIITANHDFNNLDIHENGNDVIIGENCWIGMNSVILPGVELAKGTIVGAGSIVTKKFLDGNCVIAGNPAKLIKKL